MVSELEQFYLNLPEFERNCFMALRSIIEKYNDGQLQEMWKYKLPFFYYNGKMFCYLWKDRKTQQPYIGIANAHLFDHSALTQGDRKRMKVLYINTEADLDIELIYEIFDKASATYNF